MTVALMDIQRLTKAADACVAIITKYVRRIADDIFVVLHSDIWFGCPVGFCMGKEQKMTKDLARNRLTEHIRLMGDEPLLEEDKEALEMALKALENIGHLTDRPCDVCEFHKENGCCKWTCVFCDSLFGEMR